MVIARCIKKFRRQNKIYGYRLQDLDGNIKDVSPQALKEAINRGAILILNLTVTSDGRLIDRKIEHLEISDDIIKSVRHEVSHIFREKTSDSDVIRYTFKKMTTEKDYFFKIMMKLKAENYHPESTTTFNLMRASADEELLTLQFRGITGYIEEPILWVVLGSIDECGLYTLGCEMLSGEGGVNYFGVYDADLQHALDKFYSRLSNLAI